MIKVLIVDDEILIRVGIKSCINWESNGYEIIGLAADGNQALEIIKSQMPDIVLTDIKMPNLDGLELIEEIKKQYPNIRIIVLSCYNEFDFIRTAMKLGADDYILKLSMEPQDLLKVLNNTKKEIEKNQKAIARENDNKREIKIDRNFLKEDLYKRAIENSISGEQLVEELKKLGSDISFSQSGLICSIIDNYSRASYISRMEDEYLLKLSVTNIMEELLSSYCKGDVVETNKGEFLVILDFYGLADKYKNVLEEFCLKVNDALKNYLNISLSFGISELWKDVKNFKTKYTQARLSLEQKFYYGKESVLFYDPKFEYPDKMVILDFDSEKMLVTHLENLNSVEAKKIINDFFYNIYNSKDYPPARVRIAAVEILHSFIKVAKKFEVEAEFELITLIDEEHPVDMLMKAETVLGINEWFMEVIEEFVECMLNKRLSVERPEILKLKQYISDRIYEDITLDKASKITNISKSYLSSIFKKETGESFTDYVNRKKIEEAKVLIQRQGLKTYEAAHELGFSDESYFSKLFKKYTGINPSKVGK